QEYQSLAGQLNGLNELPLPEEGKPYQWTLVLNTAQSRLLKSIYLQTSDENKKKIDSLERYLFKIIIQSTDKKTAERSKAFGEALSNALFEWSKTDGGHRGYLNNFDPDYTREEFEGSWQPPLFAQSFSHKPLHPYWGNNRTFAPANTQLALPEIIPYDTVPKSAYYKEFEAVYKKEKELTLEEKETAIWWSDDPDVTFSPGGHLYFITNALVRKKQPSLIHATQSYARVGMSVADAFIKCWKWKYHFFTERPNTFVPRFIDSKWESFWPDPPFPSFPSGHAIQASAAATALISSYENNQEFIDSAHVGRERDHVRDVDFKARSYNSIWEVAEETAQSRFYGGSHTHQDNRVGMDQGKIIAQNVINLNWKK
ncbi:MAG: phosphatase PAP2 family protein, partial [Flavobacteriaceae bacterium]